MQKITKLHKLHAHSWFFVFANEKQLKKLISLENAIKPINYNHGSKEATIK
jgi:hypothetical protein